MSRLLVAIHRFVEQLFREFRAAARHLVVTPTFTVLAIASVALALGVTVAAYSTVASVIWDTSRIIDADRLAVVTQRDQVPPSWNFVMSRSDFAILQSRVRSVPAMAASSVVAGSLNDGTRTSPILAKAVTGNFFAVTEIQIRFGRGLEPADDRSGADPVVVLSAEFWRVKTGGDEGIVGRTVRLSGHPFVVVGIVAEGTGGGHDSFGQPGVVDGDCWIPLADEPLLRGALVSGPDDPDLAVIARIPPTGTLGTFSAEVTGIGTAIGRTALSPGGLATGHDGRAWAAVTAEEIERGDPTVNEAGAGVVLLVSLVLVVACTNVANLTLARGVSRMPELAIRRALGASRLRLIREQCAESVLLAVFSGLGAVLVANALCHLFAVSVPRTITRVLILRPTLDEGAFLVAGGCLTASLLVFGVGPAVQLTRATLREQLAGEIKALPVRWRGRQCFIAGQVAISTALALIAFASAWAVRDDRRYDVGLDVAHVALGRVDFMSMQWDAARAAQAHQALEAAAREQPGFDSVAVSAGLPLGTNGLASVSVGNQKTMGVDVSATPGIFATLRVPVLAGRAFDRNDTAATAPVIVLSEHVARALFGTTDVVGRTLHYTSDKEDKSVAVIGVAGDTDVGGFRHDRRYGAVYLPLAQQDRQSVFIVGRSRDPARLLPAFVDIVRRAEPDLAVVGETGVMAMTPISFVLSLVADVSGLLSILAVLIAMLGLYGVLAHVVARRSKEIGVRMALGAQGYRVQWMVVSDGLRPVVWGLVLGLAISIGARLALRATEIGRGTRPLDTLAFAMVAVCLVGASLIACTIPARRAAQVDPNVALRTL